MRAREVSGTMMEVKDSECKAVRVKTLEGSRASSLSQRGTHKSGAAIDITVSLPIVENFPF